MIRGSIVYLKPERCPIGKPRPYIIVSNDIGNIYADYYLCVPLTSKHKRLDIKSHAIVNYHDSVVKGEEITIVKKTDILRRVDLLDADSMRKVDECLRVALGLTGNDSRKANKDDSKRR